MARPGRKRNPKAKRRNRWVNGAPAEHVGPTPEMVRHLLAQHGLPLPPPEALLAEWRKHMPSSLALRPLDIMELNGIVDRAQSDAVRRWGRTVWSILGRPFIPVERAYAAFHAASAEEVAARRSITEDEREEARASCQRRFRDALAAMTVAAGPEGVLEVSRVGVYLEAPAWRAGDRRHRAFLNAAEALVTRWGLRR